jgi:hypothetical protein
MSGESCTWTTKLTDEEVNEIKRAYATGGKRYAGGSINMFDLAKQYGVSVAQISRVVNGKQRANGTNGPRRDLCVN